MLGGKGGPCSEQFSEEAFIFNLNNCLEFTSGELDLVILVSIQVYSPGMSFLEINGKGALNAVSFFNPGSFARKMFLQLSMESVSQSFRA